MRLRLRLGVLVSDAAGGADVESDRVTVREHVAEAARDQLHVGVRDTATVPVQVGVPLGDGERVSAAVSARVGDSAGLWTAGGPKRPREEGGRGQQVGGRQVSREGLRVGVALAQGDGLLQVGEEPEETKDVKHSTQAASAVGAARIPMPEGNSTLLLHYIGAARRPGMPSARPRGPPQLRPWRQIKGTGPRFGLYRPHVSGVSGTCGCASHGPSGRPPAFGTPPAHARHGALVPSRSYIPDLPLVSGRAIDFH